MEQQTINKMPDQQLQIALNQNDHEEEIDLLELAYMLWSHILQILACLQVPFWHGA